MQALDWLSKNFNQPRRWCFELTLATKQITPCERELKTVLENGVFSCVPFSFRSHGHFEKCVCKKTHCISFLDLSVQIANVPKICQWLNLCFWKSKTEAEKAKILKIVRNKLILLQCALTTWLCCRHLREGGASLSNCLLQFSAMQFWRERRIMRVCCLKVVHLGTI